MWTHSFFFVIVLFRVDASINLNLLMQKASDPTFNPPRNALKVTPNSDTPENWKKARAEAVVRPFAGDVKSYAGYFTVDKGYQSNMYFWFFPAESNTEKAPVILWVHGGPADSAMMAVFEENGPYQIVDAKVTLREISWTKHYNVLYVDNPVGAGFSYTLSHSGYTHNAHEGSYNLYKAVTQFYKMFPEYEKNAFYMVGQSFGGKYIPVLANLIHRKNNDTSNQKINLSGMMIGGSPLDPVNQIAFGEYLYGHGLVDRLRRDELTANDVRVRCVLDSESKLAATYLLYEMYNKLNDIGHKTPLDVSDPHINMSCYDVVEAFVTREDVRKEMHVGDGRFFERKVVPWYLAWYHLESVNRDLTKTLQLGYKVLLYSGQYDMVTPPEQIDRVIASLDWKDSVQFRKTKAQLWYSHGELAGYKKSYANLQQVLVRKANHMIARSQPKWMLDLLKSFAV